MIVSFGTVDIKMAKFNSYEELEEALAQCENGSIFAGQKKGTENAWNMIAVTDNDTGEYFGIGLLTSSPAEPHALILDNGTLFLGGDSFAIAFDIYQKQVRTLMPLPSDFVDFIYIEEKHVVLIVHKKGVIVKDEDCTEIWRNSPGPISSYSVDGDIFIMEKAHGGPVAFKIKNGKKVDL